MCNFEYLASIQIPCSYINKIFAHYNLESYCAHKNSKMQISYVAFEILILDKVTEE